MSVSGDEVAGLARQILRRQELRTGFFDTTMLDRGPWDMLLRLFVAESQDQILTRQSLSGAAGLPRPVAERWVNFLEQTDMIASTRSGAALAFDGVRLTPKARAVLIDYLAAVLSDELGGASVAPRPGQSVGARSD